MNLPNTRTTVTIRDATAADLVAILAIHNDVIANTTAIYSEDAATMADRERWFDDKRASNLPIIVADQEGVVLGFATFGAFRAWPCYRHSAEHSVHVGAAYRGMGVGRTLLGALVERARGCGVHVIIGGIDADNAASLALHGSLGFTRGGTLREVGRKFDRWLDLVFMQKMLEPRDRTAPPPAEQTASSNPVIQSD